MKLDPNLRFIWRDLMSERGRYFAYGTALTVFLGAAVEIAAPYGLGVIVDALHSQGFGMLQQGLAVFLGLEALGAIIGWFRMRVRERLFQENFWHLPMQLTRRYLARPLGMLTNEDSEIDGGGVESLKDKVWNIIGIHIFSVFPNYSLALFAVGACTYVHPLAGLFALFYAGLDTAIGQKQNRYIQKRMRPIVDEFRRWDRRIREWWNAVPLIKQNGGEEKIISQVKADILPTLAADDAVWRLFFPWAVLGRRAFGQVMATVLYSAVGYAVIKGAVPVADFVLLLFSFEKIRVVLWEINDQSRELGYLMASVTKYREVLETPVPFHYGVGAEFIGTEIGVSFEKVSLTLGEGGEERQILRDVSFTIEPGERIGIVGPSGAGKSQLINLIMRGMDPQKGIVRINKYNLRDLSLMSYLRFCGIIPQKSDLFEDSVRGNVMFGVSERDWERVIHDPKVDEQVWAALRKAGLNFGDRLTVGLDTKVGYKGMRLSGGQQARMRIADAHFKLAGHEADRPRLVIADEPTAALDSLSEMAVMEHLTEALPRGTTMLMIAHRLSTVAGMDRIMFVKPLSTLKPSEPQVVIYPSLKALYEAEALFREMADAQNFRP